MNEFIKQRMHRLDSKIHELEARGAHRRALEVQEELCALTREHRIEDSSVLIQRLLRLAASYRQLGDTQQAEVVYLEVLPLLEQKPAPQDLARTLNTMGVFYCEIDQHQQAVRLFRRALDLSPGDPQRSPQLATLHNNLASSLHSIRQKDEAREHYHEALRIFALHPPSSEQAHCLCDLAELLAEEEDDRASEGLAEALQIFRRLYPAQSPLFARASMRIADLYCRTADLRRALQTLQEAAEVLKNHEQHEKELAQCINLIACLRESGPRPNSPTKA